MGGDEEPCQPDHILAREQAGGHPCPRRELRAEDAHTAELFWLAIDPRLRHLWPEMFRVLMEGTTPRERLSVIRRIRKAAHDEVVKPNLPPPLEQSMPEMLSQMAAMLAAPR